MKGGLFYRGLLEADKGGSENGATFLIRVCGGKLERGLLYWRL